MSKMDEHRLWTLICEYEHCLFGEHGKAVNPESIMGKITALFQRQSEPAGSAGPQAG